MYNIHNVEHSINPNRVRIKHGNGTRFQEKNHSIETDPEMTEIMELVVKILKTAAINILSNLMEI